MAGRYFGPVTFGVFKCQRLKTTSTSIFNHFRYFRTTNYSNDQTSIYMPALSPTMQHGTILQWHKKEGDKIEPGDVICDIQTDKAVMGFELEEEGILAKILKPDDSKDVQIGSLIALLVEDGDDWQNVEIPDQLEAVSIASSDETSNVNSSQLSSEHIVAGPAAKALMGQYNLSAGDVTGTGPRSRILKSVVKSKGLKPVDRSVPLPSPAAGHAEKPAAAPTAPSSPSSKPQPIKTQQLVDDENEFVDVPLSSMRSVIAKRLTESKTTIPHAYATIDCELTSLTSIRQQLIDSGTKVSLNDFIVKAAALALEKVPEVNAQWQNEQPTLMNRIDISVAVATENGLITPIVANAVNKNVEDIAAEIKDLATRARLNKLKPEEFIGGSFTISNLGMFGITEFSAVINPPQSCILAIGSGRLVLGEDNNVRNLVSVTLSADARVVDNHVVCRWLEAFRDVIENPVQMVVPSGPSMQSKTNGISVGSLFAK